MIKPSSVKSTTKNPAAENFGRLVELNVTNNIISSFKIASFGEFGNVGISFNHLKQIARKFSASETVFAQECAKIPENTY